MNEAQFHRLTQLSHKTGTPLIIFDADGEGSVLLPLDSYERLVGGRASSAPSVTPPVVSSPAPAIPSVPVVASSPVPRKTYEEPPDLSEDVSGGETQFYLEPVE